MSQGKYIGYVRVSTQRQGESGLGMEAQEAAIAAYLKGGNRELLNSYVEVESGKDDDRPQLRAAIEECGKKGAVLVIAKMDRLSSNLKFIINLKESGVRFIACDAPHDDETMMYFRAVIAQDERRRISERTKAALKAAKARGQKLGNPNGLSSEAAENGRKLGVEARKRKANDFAARIYPQIQELREAGCSLQEAARRLNAEGVLTARATGRWTATSVRAVIRRTENL